MGKPQNNANYRAVALHTNGFSLLKAQPDGNFLFQNHKNASFTALLRECGIFFGDGAHNVRVVTHPMAPVLVPTELFEEPAAQFLKIQTELSDNEVVVNDEWEGYAAVYPVHAGKAEQLRQAGITPFYQHSSTVLARYLQLNGSDTPHRLLLFFHGNSAESILFCYNRLAFVGSFRFSVGDEVVYHIANLLRQHEIEADDCHLLFGGEFPDAKKTFDLVNQYFPDMDWAGDRLPVSIRTADGKEVVAHTVLNLLPF